MSAGPIRTARPDDAVAILRIYAPVVRTTAISFELDPPDLNEMRERISTRLQRYPWLVFDRQGEVLGYAYAGEYRHRAAYQWSVEVSVYVDEQARRTGVAKALYSELFVTLRRQGFYNAYAGIALPNPASVALHESMGFTSIGAFRSVGFKFGRWHDVGWWQLAIQPPGSSPVTPVPFPRLAIAPG